MSMHETWRSEKQLHARLRYAWSKRNISTVTAGPADVSLKSSHRLLNSYADGDAVPLGLAMGIGAVIIEY